MSIIDGRAIASRRQGALREEVAGLAERGITPTIAPIIVGDDPSARLYYRAKGRLARELGIGYAGTELPGDVSQEELLNRIDDLNNDPCIDGIFVEMPLPKHISREAVARSVSFEKDVDGISPLSLGTLIVASASVENYRQLQETAGEALPATAHAVMEILLEEGVQLAGANAVVVGDSLSVGRPLSILLLTEQATVTVCHIRTRSLEQHTKRADVLCVAVGHPNLITSSMVKEGAVVVDIGINVTEDGVVGDVDYDGVAPLAGLITPVPGGVGPMTTTMIMQHVVARASHRAR